MTTETTIEHLAVDTGGTFTDYFAIDSAGESHSGKVSSTPDDPSQSVRAIFNELDVDEHARFVHGTTVATNALLEDELADVLFLVNEGLDGMLRVGRGTRRRLHDLNPDPSDYPFRTIDVAGVPVRNHPYLETNNFLSDREAASLRNHVREVDPDIVAVCLVHSFRDSRGEESVKSALESVDVPVVISSEVLPRFREFERSATTVINAGLRSLVSDYLGKITECSSAPRQCSVMGSGRGTMNVQDAIERPVRTVLSGPTAGIIGARQYRGTSDAGLISMDIGGTSTDVCFLADERIPLTDDKRIGRYSIAQPVADIHTIGAGGGSIVSVDRGGHLRVGPESAGADPGPACYGRGGPATVTDALVELGRIPTDRPISSELDLSSELAQKSLLERGKRLDRSPQAVAEGTMDIVLTRLSEAIRSVTVEKGHKPSNYSLVAFGGGGGLYAAQLAGRLDIETVVVPRQAGVGSARGLLNAPTCHQATISPLEMLETESGELPGIGELNARRPDWTADDVQFEAECQYEGQTHPVTVSVSENTTCDELISAFHTRYSEIFNYRPDTERVELVHLNAFWFKRPPAMEVRPPDITDSDSSRLGTTSVYLDGQSREMPMFQLEAVNETVDGPALLSGETTTVLVPNDWTMHPQPHSVRMVLERG